MSLAGSTLDAQPKEATDAAAPVSTGRLLQLDVLRGIAIVLVLGRHMPLREAGVLAPLARLWYRVGWAGVDLFFVLSGFLIGGLLFNELKNHGAIDVKRFLIRRGFKIWPSYYAYLVLVFAMLCLGFDAPVKIRAGEFVKAAKVMIPNVLNVQNYYRNMPRTHTWSLAVEEHFYLLLPFLLIWLVRLRKTGEARSLRAIPAIALATMIGCTALRVLTNWLWYSTSEDLRTFQLLHYFPTHLRLDGLMFGVLIAYIYAYHASVFAWVARYRWSVLLAGIGLLAPLCWGRLGLDPFVWTYGFTLAYLGFGCVVAAFVATPISHGILGRMIGSGVGRAFAFIGVYSYAIYLWHVDLAGVPVAWLDRKFLASSLSDSGRWAITMTLFAAGSVIAGVVMGWLIERPTLAIRDRYFPGRARALVTPKLIDDAI